MWQTVCTVLLADKNIRVPEYNSINRIQEAQK